MNNQNGGSTPSVEWVPPHSIEAEQALLGAILIDNEVLHHVAPLLEPEDFYRAAHVSIYGAQIDLYDQNLPIDYVTTVEALGRRKADGQDREAGGDPDGVDLHFLAELGERCPTSANAAAYASQIARHSILRQVINITGELRDAAFGVHEGTIADFLGTVEQKIHDVTRRDLKSDTPTFRDAIAVVFKKIEEGSENLGPIGLPSGFARLDELTGGFRDGELIIIGARPSVGKTTLGLAILRTICQAGMSAVLFSCEMRREQIVENIMSAESRVDWRRLRAGLCSDYDLDRIDNASKRASQWSFLIDDTPGVSLRAIAARARRLKDEGVLDVIMVDYLQLLRRPAGLANNTSREREVATLSAELKKLARELDIPVIVLAQLNRGMEQGALPRRPRPSDLRESGAIEQDADMVILLHRPPATPTEAELILAKNRNGPVGSVELGFDGPIRRFYEREDAGPPVVVDLPPPERNYQDVEAPETREMF